MKFSGVTILQGVKFAIFLLIFDKSMTDTVCAPMMRHTNKWYITDVVNLTFDLLTKGKKVGFLYSATYTANQNSALHNLGSGS